MSGAINRAGADPDSFTSFGALLRHVRLRAQMRQLDVALAVGYSEAQIGRLEKDQRLPNVAMVAAQFIPALGLEREPALAARLVALAEAAHQTESHASGPPEPLASTPVSALYLDPNLPQPLTPLMGRAAELAELERLLTNPEHRLITLLGPGGVGKTRLAMEVVTRNAPRFAHGTCAIGLAGAAPELLIPTIARALHLDVSREADAGGALAQHLQSRHLLLLLDNFEHLVEAAPLLVRLLAAPQLWVVVTSRERLQLRGEVTLEVAGLPLPEGPGVGPELLAASEAVQLFLATAARRAPLDLTLETLASIARICALVEGLPLAIELAAAWLHLLSVEEIERELRRTLDFLQSSLRDLPARHRSLRAAFDHSWALLAPDEQRALLYLSVFRGSFAPEAAAAQLGTLPVTLRLLGSLLDKSMLKRLEGSDGSRYVLHEVVRQYAADRLLAQPGEESEARRRHSDYYLGLLEIHYPALRGAAQQHALDALTAEFDNLRAALDCSLAKYDLAMLRRVFPSLALFLEWQHMGQEGAALFETIASCLRDAPTPPEEEAQCQSVLALAQAYGAWFTHHFGQSDGARTLARLREAHEMAVASGDELAIGDAALFLGVLTSVDGDLDAARRWVRASLRAFEACGDPWRIARALYRLGTLHDQEGDYVTAEQFFAASLARLELLGDLRARMLTLNRVGAGAARLGRFDQARRYLEANLGAARALADQRGEATTLFHMGQVSQSLGAHAEARGMFQESARLFSLWEEGNSAAEALALLGYSAVLEGDRVGARAALQEAWGWVRGDDTAAKSALMILVGWAALRLEEGDAEGAVEMLALVLAHPASTQETCDRAAWVMRGAEAHLTPYYVVAAQARGREQTIRAYLSGLDPDGSRMR
jgi:predicted ATPase/DNA-binding XRE family transcriptional regulator